MEDTENLNGSEAPKVEKIDSIIRESFAENQNLQTPTRALQASPRARGRPRRGGAPNKATLEKMKAAFSPTPSPLPLKNDQAESVVDPSIGASTPPGESVGPRTVVELPDTALKAILQLPFNLARSKTGFKGYELDDSTAEACVPLAQECIRIYFPDTDSKHAPLFALCATLGTVAVNQFIAHQDWKRESGVAIAAQKTQLNPISERTQ